MKYDMKRKMKYWRTAQIYEELLSYMSDGIDNDRIKQMQREVSNVNDFVLNDIIRLPEYQRYNTLVYLLLITSGQYTRKKVFLKE